MWLVKWDEREEKKKKKNQRVYNIVELLLDRCCCRVCVDNGDIYRGCNWLARQIFVFLFVLLLGLFRPLALLSHSVEAIAHVDVVRGEDADPSRGFVRPVVLETKGHPFVVHLPRQDRFPVELYHLVLRQMERLLKSSTKKEQVCAGDILAGIHPLCRPGAGRRCIPGMGWRGLPYGRRIRSEGTQPHRSQGTAWLMPSTAMRPRELVRNTVQQFIETSFDGDTSDLRLTSCVALSW